MSDDVKYLRGKVDKIEDHLDTMNQTLTRNTAILDVHVRRTDLLEKKVAHVDEHVKSVNAVSSFVFKLTGLMAAVIGIMWTISRLL